MELLITKPTSPQDQIKFRNGVKNHILCLKYLIFPYFHSDDFSLVYFYFTYDDAAAADGLGYLDPEALVAPSDANLETALRAANLTDIVVQGSPTFKNIQNSFGVFVDGVV